MVLLTHCPCAQRQAVGQTWAIMSELPTLDISGKLVESHQVGWWPLNLQTGVTCFKSPGQLSSISRKIA